MEGDGLIQRLLRAAAREAADATLQGAAHAELAAYERWAGRWAGRCWWTLRNERVHSAVTLV
ncbi:hypothetical protein OG386_13305 [Streptomyces sp. NBC_00273]